MSAPRLQSTRGTPYAQRRRTNATRAGTPVRKLSDFYTVGIERHDPADCAAALRHSPRNVSSSMNFASRNSKFRAK